MEIILGMFYPQALELYKITRHQQSPPEHHHRLFPSPQRFLQTQQIVCGGRAMCTEASYQGTIARSI